jgi:hypothetical protein
MALLAHPVSSISNRHAPCRASAGFASLVGGLCVSAIVRFLLPRRPREIVLSEPVLAPTPARAEQQAA